MKFLVYLFFFIFIFSEINSRKITGNILVSIVANYQNNFHRNINQEEPKSYHSISDPKGYVDVSSYSTGIYETTTALYEASEDPYKKEFYQTTPTENELYGKDNNHNTLNNQDPYQKGFYETTTALYEHSEDTYKKGFYQVASSDSFLFQKDTYNKLSND